MQLVLSCECDQDSRIGCVNKRNKYAIARAYTRHSRDGGVRCNIQTAHVHGRRAQRARAAHGTSSPQTRTHKYTLLLPNEAAACAHMGHARARKSQVASCFIRVHPPPGAICEGLSPSRRVVSRPSASAHHLGVSGRPAALRAEGCGCVGSGCVDGGGAGSGALAGEAAVGRGEGGRLASKFSTPLGE